LTTTAHGSNLKLIKLNLSEERKIEKSINADGTGNASFDDSTSVLDKPALAA
jgi:hypothetical protein